MKVAKNVLIEAPADAVWKVLGEGYAEVGTWARAVQKSEVNPDATVPAGANVGGRICQTDIGPATEVLTHFDPQARHMTYKAHADNMPFFVRALFGDWKVAELGNATCVDFCFTADLSFPFSLFMPAFMRGQFVEAIDTTLEDLKILLETGKPHPEKRATH